jgi:hypothetical protein
MGLSVMHGKTTMQTYESTTIRVIVYVAGVPESSFADVPTVQLQRWLADLDDLTDRHLEKWTIDGGQRAVRIFNVSSAAGEHLVACLAATWVVLYGPRLSTGPELSLDDLQEAGDCTLTVRVSSNGRRWAHTLAKGHDTAGGVRMVPGRAGKDFDTVGNA